MLAKSIYHAAYHCNNMQETVDFYTVSCMLLQ